MEDHLEGLDELGAALQSSLNAEHHHAAPFAAQVPVGQIKRGLNFGMEILILIKQLKDKFSEKVLIESGLFCIRAVRWLVDPGTFFAPSGPKRERGYTFKNLTYLLSSDTILIIIII